MKIWFTLLGRVILFTSKAVALPLKKRALRARRLVVVEIESITEGAVRTRVHASWAKRLVEEAIGLKEGEQVIVGAPRRSVLATGMSWPEHRIVTGTSPEDTQRELLRVLEDERVGERFDELVLVSGNGLFADAIAALAADGVMVTALAWPENLSKRLRLAVAATLLLERYIVELGGIG